jgi:hypothetical protein
MNRDRILTHSVRRTKDPTPDSLCAHLLPVLIARPDPPRSDGNGASSDVRLRHVCGRKGAEVVLSQNSGFRNTVELAYPTGSD